MDTASDTSGFGCFVISLILFVIIAAIVGAFIGYTSHNFMIMLIILGVILTIELIVAIIRMLFD